MVAKTSGTNHLKLISAILSVFRIVVFLFCMIMYLRLPAVSQTQLLLNRTVMMCFGIFQILTAIVFTEAMKYNSTRLLLSFSEILAGLMAVYLTGGIQSPFVAALVAPVFTLHFIYKLKGLALGVMACLAGSAGIYFASGGYFQFLTEPIIYGSTFTGAFIMILTLILLYFVPYISLRRYFYNSFKVKSLEGKYTDLDIINSKLLTLYEMTGCFNFENGTVSVMDKLLALCRELFGVERSCLFLIRKGEVEIYGQTNSQEKERLYRLVMEQRSGLHREDESDYFCEEGAVMVPLVRGARVDGVLCLYGWNEDIVTNKDAILFALAGNMICTYLENLEYVESLMPHHQNDTSIIVNHLDSGRPVKGILDKRILPN